MLNAVWVLIEPSRETIGGKCMAGNDLSFEKNAFRFCRFRMRMSFVCFFEICINSDRDVLILVCKCVELIKLE